MFKASENPYGYSPKCIITEEVRDQYFKSPYKIAEDGYVRFKQDTIISKLKKQFEEECKKEKEKAMFNDVKVLYDGHSYYPTTIEMISHYAGESPVLRIECPVGYVAYHTVTPKKPEPKFPEIKKVIFNDPATIVLWEDGTKTVVKCENEKFDPEKGLAMAITKKVLGNNGHYFETIKKWTKDWYVENTELMTTKVCNFTMQEVTFDPATLLNDQNYIGKTADGKRLFMIGVNTNEPKTQLTNADVEAAVDEIRRYMVNPKEDTE